MNEQTKHFYQFGSFRIDPAERLLLHDGENVRLTPKVFEVLLYLVENRGRVLDKDELMKKIWSDTFVEEINLAKNISVLRKALGEDGGGAEVRYIETIPKRGYRFVADVEQVWDEANAVELSAGENTDTNTAVQENTTDDEVKVEEELKKDVDVTQPANLDSQHSKGNRLVWLFGFVAFALLAVAAIWFAVSRPTNRSPSASQKIIPFTTFPGSESNPAISPDGKQIAFAWRGESGENVDIYVKLVGAGESLRLTSEPAIERNPVWSPDGSQIAFLRESPGSGSIYVVPSLGGTARKLADTYGLPFSWSPTGEFLAMAEKNSREEPFSLFLLSTKTGEKQKLTNPPAQSYGDRNPVFSPDGKALAFVRTSAIDVEDIYLLPVAGGEPQRLTFDNKFTGGLDWTADGREIVFSSTRAGNPNLWRISVTGGTPQLLPGIGTNAVSPSVSRQGNRLAYMQSTEDSNIWRIELSNHKARTDSPTMLISSTLNDYSPDFSPDGGKIVFGSNRSGNWEIWLANSDGTNPLQITSVAGSITGSPRFSPDSRRIVFDSRPDGNADIFIINTEGGNPRRLTTENTEDILPNWSRDGQWIYYRSNRSGQPQIWKMSPEGERATQVTKQGGYEAFESPDGKYIYYTKGRNTSGIWRVPVEGGEETPVVEFLGAGFLRYWTVTDEGVYFGTRVTSSPTIQFFSFATGQLNEVFKVEKPLLVGNSGLALSSDGKNLLFAQIDQSGSDIMLIDNFR